MENLVRQIQERFNEMCKTGKLFRLNVEGDLIWNAYLIGFNNDPIFRSTDSSVHNCNYCHSFIRRYGNVVALDENYNIMTLFDIENPEEEYSGAIKEIQELLRSCTEIKDIFIETFDYLKRPNISLIYNTPSKTSSIFNLGVEKNTKTYQQEDVDRWPNSGITLGQMITFRHFHLTIPRKFIDFSGRSIGDLCSGPRSIKESFKKGLDKISLDTLVLVKDLEAQGSLLNGQSYKHIVDKAIKYSREYAKIPQDKKDVWCWIKSLEWGPGAAFRGTAIGTLMIDLAEGKEINAAVQSFNKKVDPVNYMKATAPITKKQIKEAEKFVEDNGYNESFERRCATIDDINVSDILHSNMSAAEVKTKVSVFSSISPTNHSRHKKSEFKGIQEVTIDKFMSDILPTCESVEVYLQNKHEKNFVNLLTSAKKESKGIFKWNNNFSWTYSGNLTGTSQIKQAVKNAGGFVDAPFRFSIMWNEDGRSIVDFDAHMREPDCHDIYYGSNNINKDMNLIDRVKSACGGVLDIDMIRPNGVGIENIFYPTLNTMKDGVYRAYVNNYDGGRNTGIKAEIFFNGSTWQFTVPHEVNSDIEFAKVTIKGGDISNIDVNEKYLTDHDEISKKIYGLDTCEFHKVNLVCLSPNFWEDKGVGNKHYFFMLEGAENPEEIRSIHNEYLNDDLRAHRKVMEVLGSTLKVKSVKGQLAGLGFNSTVRDEVILRLGGSHKRVIIVKF